MKYGLLVCALLMGCSTPQERIASLQARCTQIGFQAGTNEHAQCVQDYLNTNRTRDWYNSRRPQNVRVVP